MGLTVHDAKRVHAELVDAFAAAESHLVHEPDLGAVLGEARAASSRLASAPVSGRSADPADTGTVNALRDAVAAGRSILGQTDVGRKVSRFERRIDEADHLLSAP